MAHPRKPPTNSENDNMANPQPANDPLAPENIPKGDFIDIASNKPVDPTRFQVFELPRQFLEWVLAKEPPHLDLEDLKDIAPRGLPVDRSKLVPRTDPAPEPECEYTPRSTGSLRIAIAPRASNPPPSVEFRQEDTNATVAMRVRRPTSLLTYWALTGKVPRRVKLAFAAVFGILILILAWKHLDTSKGAAVPKEESPSSISAMNAIAGQRSPNQEVKPTQSLEQSNSIVLRSSSRISLPKTNAIPVKRNNSEPSLAVQSRADGTNARKNEQKGSLSNSRERGLPENAGTASAKPTNNASQDKTWFPED